MASKGGTSNAGSRKKPAGRKTRAKKSFSLISDATLRRMYTAMLGCRALEERAARELRKARSRKQPQLGGSLGEQEVALGQEAIVVGTTLDLGPEDTIAAPSSEVIVRTSVRASAATINKQPRGKAARIAQAEAEARRNVIAFAASSGAQLTIGTGVALAYRNSAKDGGTPRVVVAFGDADGASISSWSEALHLAGLHQLPILFVLRPAHAGNEGGVETICAHAKLAGVTAIPVDAMDVVAMYRVSFESLVRARKGTGATLIVSTRFAVDGSADSAARGTADPIAQMETYLANKGLFSAAWKAEMLQKFR